jgi:hypothetical protein
LAHADLAHDARIELQRAGVGLGAVRPVIGRRTRGLSVLGFFEPIERTQPFVIGG